jgi:hypothetical protein
MRGELRQARAGELLGIGVRQVKQLVRGCRCEGAGRVMSRRGGRPSNNRLEAARLAAIEAALMTRYSDFGATLASEKLREIEGVRVSKETVRQIQIRLGLRRPRQRRAKKVFQVRERLPRFGELIQIDGSPHDWFEGRGPRRTLIVFIDDASGRLTHLRFAPAETTKAYLQALEAHVLAHGLPPAHYSDRHGIFRVNAKEAQGGDGCTEFGRVAERLRIELIHATTPQAKGRVESRQPDLAGSADQGDAPGRHLMHRRGAGVRRRLPRTLEQKVRGRPASGRGRASAVVRLQGRSRGGSGAPGRAHPLQGAHLQRRRDPLRRQDARTGDGAARSQNHASAHARRDHARTLQRPRPGFYAVHDPNCPAPVEDDKTVDARLDAVIARNDPSAIGSPRKGADNGLARYGAMRGALGQAVIHPHSNHSPPSEKGHFYFAGEGDISTLP